LDEGAAAQLLQRRLFFRWKPMRTWNWASAALMEALVHEDWGRFATMLRSQLTRYDRLVRSLRFPAWDEQGRVVATKLLSTRMWADIEMVTAVVAAARGFDSNVSSLWFPGKFI
jgi:hypothetical protein